MMISWKIAFESPRFEFISQKAVKLASGRCLYSRDGLIRVEVQQCSLCQRHRGPDVHLGRGDSSEPTGPRVLALVPRPWSSPWGLNGRSELSTSKRPERRACMESMEPDFAATTKRISEAIERIRQIRFASDVAYEPPAIEEPYSTKGLDLIAVVR